MKSVWAIGDIQGCCEALDRLLAHPALVDDPQARFWFAGDIVNRGPASLASLRRVMSLNARAVTVLGNHDLHLLAMAAGVRRPHANDTLADILAAPDAPDLIDWVRSRPLAHAEDNYLMVHAGVLPGWNADDTLARAREVEAVLRGPDWKTFMAAMYGDTPRAWSDDLRGADRLRVIVNALTRMRFCTDAGVMEFATKDNAGAAPPGYVPWFDAPARRTAETTVVFGHWSTLGLVQRPNLLALDTGCVWGGELSAMRLYDRKLVQISCGNLPGALSPDNGSGAK